MMQRDHRGGGFVVLFRADAFGFLRREHFPAEIAAQPVEFIHRGAPSSVPCCIARMRCFIARCMAPKRAICS
jgi:hypothetical protein